MALTLPDLVELALLDGAMDKPVTLDTLYHAAPQWHELNGRSDVQALLPSTLVSFIKSGAIMVTEGQGGRVLSMSEASMAQARMVDHPEVAAALFAVITDDGKRYYKQLAHRYYNG